MPRKIREIERDLKRAKFTNRGGKGSHRVYEHESGISMTVSGHPGDDAQRYQEADLKEALAKVKK